jgi:oxygen-independent coproporphyrinogen III oxidase
VRRVLPRAAPGLEVTIEGVAHLFTQPKLEAMREAGVTRASLGVQQLDPRLLEASGRKQDAAHVLRMIESCHALGLGTNVDLIFGWPGQSIDAMQRDLETLVRHRVAHITHYELNLAGRTDFARRRAGLPSVQENLDMYRAAKQFLQTAGYRQVTPYDWERIDAGERGTNRYETLGRTSFKRDGDGGITGYDGFGWGFAGISPWFGSPAEPGWIYVNERRVDDYYRALDAGRFPVERGYRYTREDIRMFTLFQMLQGFSVDRVLYRDLFGLDPVDEHPAIWPALRPSPSARSTSSRVASNASASPRQAGPPNNGRETSTPGGRFR